MIIIFIESAGIAVIDRIVKGEAVEVETPCVADGITGQEPACGGIIVAVRQQAQPCLHVPVVAELSPEAHRVVIIDSVV